MTESEGKEQNNMQGVSNADHAGLAWIELGILDKA
jgi:hypothetical protein